MIKTGQRISIPQRKVRKIVPDVYHIDGQNLTSEDLRKAESFIKEIQNRAKLNNK